MSEPEFREPWDRDPEGPLVPPGRYSAEVAELSADDGYEALTEPQWFEVRPTPDLVDPTDDREPDDAGGAAGDFTGRVESLGRAVAGSGRDLDSVRERIKHLRATIRRAPPTGSVTR